MSVFGGDSWAREAQQRKRRVDDLLLSSSYSSVKYKKLSNGKYACLVCPHNPVLDSPLSFSIHSKGSRHMAAASKLKDRELSVQEQLNKRLALSSYSTTSSTPIESVKEPKVKNQPLIEQTRKAILEAQCNRSWDQNAKVDSVVNRANTSDSHSDINNKLLEESSKTGESESMDTNKAFGKMLAEWNKELSLRKEKELKFIAAGWKRNGFGKWYKDENVEFDSDEEDPNDCLQ